MFLRDSITVHPSAFSFRASAASPFSGIVGAIAQTGITKLAGDVALDAR